MLVRGLILTAALVGLLSTGCRNAACCRRPAPTGYSSPPSIRIPPPGIPDDSPPPLPGPGPRRDTGSEFLIPEPIPKGRSKTEYGPAPDVRSGAILEEPEAVEKPRVVPAVPAPPENTEADPPLPKSSGKADPPPPVGIREFTQVKDGVSAGQRPELEGLDWLEKAGYKTVVMLRGSGDEDVTDRRQVEKRRIAFVALEVTPATLTREWMTRFNDEVGRAEGRPVFVYAKDPAVAGAVWYLHLRMAEFLTHDEARVRALQLGTLDEKSEIFQAARKLLPAS